MKQRALTLSSKLIGGFLMVAVITCLVGALGYHSLNCAVDNNDVIIAKTKNLTQAVDLVRLAQVNFKKQVQAWKDILLRGTDPTAFAKYLDEFNRQEALVQQNLAALKSLLTDAGVSTDLVDESLRTHADLGGKYREALKSYDPAKQDVAGTVDKLVKGIDRGPTDEIDKIVDQVRQFDSETTKKMESHFYAQTQWIKRLTLAGVSSGVFIAVILGIVVSGSLTKQISRLAHSLDHGSNEVANAAGHVASTSQNLAKGASEQAASLEETSSSLEEMSSMTKRNAEHSQKASDLAKQARAAADKGVIDVLEMNTAMAAVKAANDDITKIIKTIDEIAFQTNILALNAAVESARAGEAGMGFAVVADEVRNLAQRSAQAAKETTGKIEGAISKTAQGVEICRKVVETLNEIVTKVRQVDELAAEVANASSAQTQGITQINLVVGQMDKVTQSNAANAEESAAAAEELNAQAETLKQSVIDLLQLVDGNNIQLIATGTPVSWPSAKFAPTDSFQTLAENE